MSTVAKIRKYRPGQQFVVSYKVKFFESNDEIHDTDVFGLYKEIEQNDELSDGEVTMLLKDVIIGYKKCSHKDDVVIYNWWLY